MYQIVKELADDLLSSSEEIWQAIERKGCNIDADEAEALLGEFIERCPECDVWVESGELIDENLDHVPCDSCKVSNKS